MKNKNLIGINGLSGSGKDLIASIIQYLTSGFADRKTYSDWQDWPWRKDYSDYYTIKKFAEPLKQIICILTGCSMLDLESQEFKATLSPLKCWIIRYKHMDFELGDYVHDIEYFNTKENAEEEMKRVQEVWDSLLNRGGRWHEGKVELLQYTYRELLRRIGTDLFRNQLHPTIWSTALFAKYKNNTEFPVYNKGKEVVEKVEGWWPHWIISDLRFKDELLAIQERKGITIKVTRPCSECGFSGVHANTCSKKDEVLHQSEHDLDEATFDYCISNDSTIDSLIEKVKHILTKEKII